MILQGIIFTCILGVFFVLSLTPVQNWFRVQWRGLSGDTRDIVEPPQKKSAVRCGKCYCKFTYTARDVRAYYSESHIYCPSCKQKIRIWSAKDDERYGIDPG